jgi:hypothetical protein
MKLLTYVQISTVKRDETTIKSQPTVLKPRLWQSTDIKRQENVMFGFFNENNIIYIKASPSS